MAATSEHSDCVRQAGIHLHTNIVPHQLSGPDHTPILEQVKTHPWDGVPSGLVITWGAPKNRESECLLTEVGSIFEFLLSSSFIVSRVRDKD